MEDELLSWLKRAKNEYARRKRSAERRAVRWEWATSDNRALEPFYFERHGFSRGKRLPGEPKPIKEGHIAYGIDAQDRVVVERSYAGIVGHSRRWFCETFYDYAEGTVEWVRFDASPDKDPVAVHRAMFSGNRILSLTMRGQYGGSAERYLYDSDRIMRIERDVLESDDPRSECRTWSDWFEVHWDDLGRVEKITEWDPHESRLHTVFQRPSKGQTLKDVIAVLEPQLVAQIPKAVAALRLKEPAYSLVLAYDGEGNDMLPPAIGVGLAQERDEWIATKPADAKWLLWNPAEYKHYNRGPLSLKDKKLLSLCGKANQGIAMNDKWSVGRGLLDRVATSLRTVSWKSMMPVTDDFVVYAVDFELGRLRKSLQAAAKKDQFRQWLRAQLVP